MKIVVTGGLGHIGSRLIRALPVLFEGAEIVILDDMSTQRFPSLFDLPGGVRYRFVEADVTEADLASHFADADAVVHLAAMVDAASSFDRKAEVERVNLTATRRVAEAAAAAGAGVIFPSSTSVYGTQAATVDEDCPEDELRPQSPYAATKLREEHLLREMAASSNLRFVICRFGTIFGASPGIRFHTAVNKFCWQAVMGQPLTVWKTAYEQMRPYLDVGDAVNAIALIIKGGHFDGRVYNVLTANATVSDVVEALRANVPGLEVSFVDAQIMNQLSYEVSDARFRGLGFTPEGDLASGIEETVALLSRANWVTGASQSPGGENSG